MKKNMEVNPRGKSGRIKKEKRRADHIRSETIPPRYNSAVLMALRAADYFKECDESGKGYTEAGLLIALHLQEKDYSRYKTGDKDAYSHSNILTDTSHNIIDMLIEHYKSDSSLIPYYCILLDIDKRLIDTNSIDIIIKDKEEDLLFSRVLQKARQLITLSREQALADKGRVSDIFTLKAREGWTDSPQTTHTTIELRQPQDIKRIAEILHIGEEH